MGSPGPPKEGPKSDFEYGFYKANSTSHFSCSQGGLFSPLGPPLGSLCLAGVPIEVPWGGLWRTLSWKSHYSHQFFSFFTIHKIPLGTPLKNTKSAMLSSPCKNHSQSHFWAPQSCQKANIFIFFACFYNSSKWSAVVLTSIYVFIAALLKCRV